VKLPVTNEYQLNAFSAKQLIAKPRHLSLLVTLPEAVAGYQTEAMLYVKKPFQLESFAKNAWTSPPAEMLYPLLVQSLQRSGYFYAVSSSAYSEKVDYRLDTQLLSLEQNFLNKPSKLIFSVKAVLTRIDDSKVIASRIITQQIPCSSDTPYGGVVAANKASLELTATIAQFVVSNIKHE
ncbi:MAG: ABC-type transport auxiliary lipoprotein family protein, partial [bacterium]|nr:ABC-type transport auxiliary lipoprotein family protein [bacterium]